MGALWIGMRTNTHGGGGGGEGEGGCKAANLLIGCF